MLLRLILLSCLAVNALPSSSQLESASQQTREKCEQYLQIPLPAEANSVSAPKVWPDCNSYKLYSGIGTLVDYAGARRCAWSERLAQQANLEPRYTVASVLGGSAMLAVLYANGNGVTRDLAMAQKFACEAEGAPAEISGRLEHLDSLDREGASGGRFTFCDDITSGFMEGFCSAYSSELRDQRRAAALHDMRSHFTPNQRSAFDRVLTAEAAYAEAHGRGEVDQSGTARAMFEIDAEDSVKDDFLEALQSFETGKLPASSPEDYAVADRNLNATYRAIMSKADESKNGYGAVQPDGIRDAERAWLRYRDAWIAFAKLRYPAVPAEAWLSLLTKDRTSVLDGSFCAMDAVEGRCAQRGDTWKPSPLP